MASISLTDFRFQKLGPFNLKIDAEQCVSLTGPSGTGKSLLLRAIADLDPHQGEAYIDDKSCGSIAAPQWRRWVGLLPAKSAWWFDTVGEHFQDVNQEWLRDLGFTTEVMNWTVSRLSSGEQQRLSLLRLLQNTPKVLLLDEPTASLDEKNIQRVESLIDQYRQSQQCAVIWVTHDKIQAQRVATKHWVMQENRLYESKQP